MSEILLTQEFSKPITRPSNQKKILSKNKKPLVLQPPLIQAKFAISQPGDKYEQEADRIAEAVVNPGQNVSGKSISFATSPPIQRQEQPVAEQSNDEKLKKSAEKTGEAFLKTSLGQEIKEKALKLGMDFVNTLPGKIITGAAAVSTVTYLAATNSKLPMQLPEIPLDLITPGLKVKLTYEGPVRNPTAASITFIFEEKVKSEEKKGMTEAEKYRAETARIAADQEKFREGLKSPEQRAKEKAQFERAFWAGRDRLGLRPLNISGLKREDELLQRKEADNSPTGSFVPPIVHEVLSSPGQTLDPATRAYMEPRFGHDFSRVRVHTDEKAAESARAVNAMAFTVGKDVVFGRGQYAPQVNGRRSLLAHELVHVVQQAQSHRSTRGMSARLDSEEQQAEQVVDTLGWGGLSSQYGTVALDVTWHPVTRKLPALPELLPASAQIQRVQLTYDDGPDNAGNTRAVLDALNAAGARATFYLIGKRVAQGDNWRIVFDIAAAGHWLGNHAYDWNDATDEHIFLSGTPEDRAQKILQTEWVIRDALIKGRDDAKKKNSWNTIPQANRDYIEDIIAHGTGRFRTPGFGSHWWTKKGNITLAALESVNNVLAASGLRTLAITEVTSWGITREGVTIDPKDYRPGLKQSDIESGVKGDLTSNTDSILLHSRIKASAEATPAIVSEIKSKKFTFDPTVQGTLGSELPKAGFAGLSTISDPPTSSEIAKARKFLQSGIPSFGGFIAGSVAIGIFKMAQRAGSAEVDAFVKEIRDTKVDTPEGKIPMANWMNANPEWRLFSSFFENWVTQKPFPRIKGITI